MFLVETGEGRTTPATRWMEVSRDELSDHRQLHLIKELIDDRVQPKVNAFPLRRIGDAAFRPYVEPHDDGP